MSRVLYFLQALVIIGALTSLIQPLAPYRFSQLTLVSTADSTTRALVPEQKTFLRVAFTILGISLL